MKKLFCVMLFSGCVSLQAQQSTVASGGNATGSGGTVSYSVGQISYKSPEGVLISDGVQQPYEIISLGKNDLPGIQLSVFPNPVSNRLTLKNTDSGNGAFTYSLSDISGKILLEPKSFSAEASLAMENYPSGIYLLKICGSDKKTKTFKIIKK
ncbi:T9SS type A sorting domain-containing protein [Flavobacterium pallidum]|nr:T9SS type A sorting domain-containing protein [Flavobacterium pallidum]